MKRIFEWEFSFTPKLVAPGILAGLIIGTDLLGLRIGAAIFDGVCLAGILWLYANK